MTTSTFLGTSPTRELITSGLPVTRAQHRSDSRLRVDHQARSSASIAGSPIIKGPAPRATYCAHSATSLV